MSGQQQRRTPSMLLVDVERKDKNQLVAAAVASFQQKRQKTPSAKLRSIVPKILANDAHVLSLMKLGNTVEQPDGFIIYPNSDLHRIWTLVIMFLVLYNIIVFPLDWAFRPFTSLLSIVPNMVIEVFFLVDFFAQFYTAYSEVGGHIVTSRERIAYRYFRSYLILDLLGSLPVDIVRFFIIVSFSIPMQSGLLFVSALKFLRCLRLVRWWRNNPSLIVNYWSLLRLLLALVVITHVLACMWFAMVSGVNNGGFTWFTVRGISESDPLSTLYLESLFGMLTLVMGEDTGPRSDPERFFCFLVLLLGSVIFACVLGNVTVLVHNMDVGYSAFRDRMRALSNNMKYLNLPQPLQTRITTYYEYCWDRFRGVDMNAFFRGDRSSEIPLSGALHSEVALYLHAEVVLSCPLFRDSDSSFIYAIVMALRLHIASPGDYIVHKGEPAEDMYFITRGVAAVLDDCGNPMVELGKGSFFGEIAIVLGGTRSRSVLASSYLELHALSALDLCAALKSFPEEALALVQVARDRMRASREQLEQGGGGGGGVTQDTYVQDHIHGHADEEEDIHKHSPARRRHLARITALITDHIHSKGRASGRAAAAAAAAAAVTGGHSMQVPSPVEESVAAPKSTLAAADAAVAVADAKPSFPAQESMGGEGGHAVEEVTTDVLLHSAFPPLRQHEANAAAAAVPSEAKQTDAASLPGTPSSSRALLQSTAPTGSKSASSATAGRGDGIDAATDIGHVNGSTIRRVSVVSRDTVARRLDERYDEFARVKTEQSLTALRFKLGDRDAVTPLQGGNLGRMWASSDASDPADPSGDNKSNRQQDWRSVMNIHSLSSRNYHLRGQGELDLHALAATVSNPAPPSNPHAAKPAAAAGGGGGGGGSEQALAPGFQEQLLAMIRKTVAEECAASERRMELAVQRVVSTAVSDMERRLRAAITASSSLPPSPEVLDVPRNLRRSGASTLRSMPPSLSQSARLRHGPPHTHRRPAPTVISLHPNHTTESVRPSHSPARSTPPTGAGSLHSPPHSLPPSSLEDSRRQKMHRPRPPPARHNTHPGTPGKP